MKWLIVTCVLLSSGHIWDSFGLEVTAQENTKMLPSLSTSSVIEKTSTEDAIINESEKISPKIVEESPARQGPQAPGWGGLLSGKKIIFKGQLISKFLFGAIVWTKIPTKFFPEFLP